MSRSPGGPRADRGISFAGCRLGRMTGYSRRCAKRDMRESIPSNSALLSLKICYLERGIKAAPWPYGFGVGIPKTEGAC
jgi:hypothetical protein